MPDAVERRHFGLGQRDAVRGEHALKDAPVQAVDGGPGQRARAHLLHCRLAAGPPVEREAAALGAQAQSRHFGSDAAVPVHDGAEDVEGEGADVVRHVWQHSGTGRQGPPARTQDARAAASAPAREAGRG